VHKEGVDTAHQQTGGRAGRKKRMHWCRMPLPQLHTRLDTMRGCLTFPHPVQRCRKPPLHTSVHTLCRTQAHRACLPRVSTPHCTAEALLTTPPLPRLTWHAPAHRCTPLASRLDSSQLHHYPHCAKAALVTTAADLACAQVLHQRQHNTYTAAQLLRPTRITRATLCSSSTTSTPPPPRGIPCAHRGRGCACCQLRLHH
jgi:hypothetical protein